MNRILTLGYLTSMLLLTMDAAAAPGGGGGGTTPPPTNPWTGNAVPDPSLDYGGYASVARTTVNCGVGGFYIPCTLIGVAHQNKTNGDLIYSTSTNGGATFTHTTVDFGEAGDIVGQFVSLAFLGSTPVISYRNSTDGTLWFARRVGSGNGNCGTSSAWRCDDLGSGGLYSSIATDDNGRVVIAHSRSGGGVHLKTGLPPYSNFVTQTVVSESVRSVAVEIDSIHQIHVGWVTASCARYTYAFFEEIETIECSPAGPVQEGGRLSMVVNVSQRPHMAYTLNSATGSYRVRHAFKVSYDTWSIEPVATVTTPQPGTSITLASDGIATEAISWGTTVSGVTRLHVAGRGGLLPWTAATADTPGGAHSGLVRWGVRLAAVHYDSAAGDLRFAIHD